MIGQLLYQDAYFACKAVEQALLPSLIVIECLREIRSRSRRRQADCRLEGLGRKSFSKDDGKDGIVETNEVSDDFSCDALPEWLSFSYQSRYRFR